jgi:Zn-dependent metalloprotease
VLRTVAERGDERQRALALRTLALDETLRSARLETGARLAAAGPQRLSAAAPLREPARTRLVRDAGNTEELQSPIVRREGDPPVGDAAVDEAFEYLGVTWDFFFQVFARDSIDQQGMALDCVVHFGEDYDNAFWNGEQMVFGDGSGVIFDRLTQSLSVCAHELAHGVIQYDGPLVYQRQSGALNESVADCFGAMIDQYHRGETAGEADWLIGRELLADGVTGRALRSLADPGSAYDDDVLGKDPQPGHMDGFVHTTEDNGGVHINSGIPNRAFHRLATTLGGPSWEHAGRILYGTLGHPRLRATASFRSFARVSADVARTIYGAQSREADAVASAWADVGVEL